MNGKFYIGKHITDDPHDDYLGSGLLIRAAIKKYGCQNFYKEVLEIFLSEREMNLAERIYVVRDIEVSYNLCPGGKGGWGYINDGSESHKKRASKAAIKSNTKEKAQKSLATRRAKNGGKIPGYNFNPPNWTGRKHTPEALENLKRAKKDHGLGQANSQYGTMWITNGIENRKIKKDATIPDGWYKGRKFHLGSLTEPHER